jgi:uncharacterized membrane protein HdeD (DUF308 family)
LTVRPASTLLALIWLLGVYFLTAGVVSLVSIISDRSNLIWKLVYGIMGAVAGLFIIGNPVIGAIILPATMALYIGVMAMVMGIIILIAAFKGGGAGEGIMGLLSIIFGIILIGSPFIAALTLLYFQAMMAIAGGLVLIFAAFKVKKATEA